MQDCKTQMETKMLSFIAAIVIIISISVIVLLVDSVHYNVAEIG